jgi:hypothetical protein
MAINETYVCAFIAQKYIILCIAAGLSSYLEIWLSRAICIPQTNMNGDCRNKGYI